MWFAPKNPLQAFSFLSLLLIALMALAIGVAQSAFFRDSVLEREAAIIHDLVQAHVTERLTTGDVDRPMTASAQLNLERSFAALRDLTGAVRLKAYDSTNRIIWSDEPALIGKVVAGETRVHRALAGSAGAVLDPKKRASHAEDRLPDIPLVEFYVPFTVKRHGSGGEVVGAFALYRNAGPLNETIARGRLLLIAVAGAGGLLLYSALFTLYRGMYRRRREAELRLSRLSSEHARIVQMEKLSAMGTLIGEVAHQFNNPLVGVLNLAQLAERNADDPQRTRELVGEIRRAGEHCRGFVQRMLTFTQIARFERQRVDLVALVRETMDLLHQSHAQCPPVTFDAPPGDTVLDADPVLLRHALFNLLANAIQADSRGPVTVRLEAGEHNGLPQWRLSVTDSGPGIAPEAMKKLFTPFFSTRPGGSGLGLAVVQYIVTQHGGHVTAENPPGGGARFTLWLPVGTKESAHDATHPAG